MTTHHCHKCGLDLPLEQFTKSGLRTNTCRGCVRRQNAAYYHKNKEKELERNREYHKRCKDRVAETKWKSRLLAKYRITLEEFSRMLDEQGGVCAICKRPASLPGRGQRRKRTFAGDHDHNTGAIRGVLCGNCNTALGQFCDSIDVLRNAIEYLEKARSNHD